MDFFARHNFGDQWKCFGDQVISILLTVTQIIILLWRACWTGSKESGSSWRNSAANSSGPMTCKKKIKALVATQIWEGYFFVWFLYKPINSQNH